ncbi:DUF3570 domain-containing protein [Neolewinella antarctica]|uniref:DUF3570 domain-containing protein n=1 Tax=Neolewinella antarctica TaxID=442734 RepID=A0ABX0XCM5_9BACT|nr:DUF3570 domain-containing protein [Neolewinella antarctica]NJC26669.1 hypothetical protein [Neolewinella antarctica]
MRYIFLAFTVLLCICVRAQNEDNSLTYKKRVLENTELQILTSYYQQSGDFAAVTGGTGTEELTDLHPTVIVAVPLNEDAVLTASVGISAYSSASSSNVNPFDGSGRADPFQASSGASQSDAWKNVAVTYTKSADDRNTVWSAFFSGSTEYDYTSVGFGGGYTKLFNEKNTELTLKASAYIDGWSAIYPSELRPFFGDGAGLNASLFDRYEVTGNANYAPNFTPLEGTGRQSYNVGANFSQLLSRTLQGMLSFDFVQQNGLLSTPFQRVYFADVENSFIEDFALADDIERLPDTRTKYAIGGRLHAYLSEHFVVRTFYRYFTDDWGNISHTLNVEVPIKLGTKLTLRPAYRFYTQTATDYFAPYDAHLSTSQYYTSDYDLSDFNANQYTMGLSYTDVLTGTRLLGFGLKSIEVDLSSYGRDNGFAAFHGSLGVKLVRD